MISLYSGIHTFKTNGKYFLIDFIKGEFLKVDEAAYRALQHDIAANQVSTLTFIPPTISAQEAHPERMTLLVNQECNLACDYCYGDKGEYGNKGKMTAETAIRAIDYLLKKSEERILYRVHFFGGEPLLNFPVIKKVAEYTTSVSSRKDISIILSVTTNGTILNDEILEFFIKHDVSVCVSMDGPKEIHDRYRKFADGSGSFDTIAENVQRMIAKLSKGIAVHATLTEQSPPRHELRSYLEKLGFKYIEFSHVSDYSTCNGSYYSKDVKSIGFENELGFEMQTLLKRYTRDQIIAKCKDMKKVITADLKIIKYYNCNAGSYKFSVDIEGYIYICTRFIGMPAFRVGNVWDGVDEGQYVKFFNDFDTSRKACNSCWAGTMCGRGCYRNAVKDGRFCEPDEQMCNQRRKAIEKMIYSYFEFSDYCAGEGFNEKGVGDGICI